MPSNITTPVYSTRIHRHIIRRVHLISVCIQNQIHKTHTNSTKTNETNIQQTKINEKKKNNVEKSEETEIEITDDTMNKIKNNMNYLNLKIMQTNDVTMALHTVKMVDTNVTYGWRIYESMRVCVCV